MAQAKPAVQAKPVAQAPAPAPAPAAVTPIVASKVGGAIVLEGGKSVV